MQGTVDMTHAIKAIDSIHDGRHKLKDGPFERESVPYVIPLPEHNMGAFIYTWVDREGVAGSFFVVYGPGVGDQPIVEKVGDVRMSADRNLDDWKVGNVHLQQNLDFKTARIKVDGEQASMDLVFEALHPPYAYDSHEEGCPDWFATNRIEQAGRIRGVLRVGDKTYDVDTTGARDHSWGTREWLVPQHWKWVHAQAGQDVSVHFCQIFDRGSVVLRGYISRDGLTSELVSADVDFTLDDQFLQKTIEVKMLDQAGREVLLKGDFYAHFPLVPEEAQSTLYESSMTCEIDGKPGVGWAEFMWPTAYLDYHRSRTA